MADEPHPFTPKAPERMVNHVYRELRRAILQRKLPPNERLIETTLASLLQVSRTPVREALLKLESEGLVRRVKGGLLVGDTMANLAEVILLRQRMEALAARLATERGTDEELRVIAEAADAEPGFLETATYEQRAERDRRFHMAIGRACHSPRIERLVEEFYEYSFREENHRSAPDHMVVLQDQHRRIAAAITARNADWAEREVESHLAAVLREVQQSFTASGKPDADG